MKPGKRGDFKGRRYISRPTGLANMKQPRRISVFANYFNINFKEAIYKYSINIVSETPIPPENYQELSRKYLIKSKENRAIIAQLLGPHYIFLNNALYSTHLSTPFEVSAADNPELKIQVGQQMILTKEKDAEAYEQLMGRLVKSMLKRLKLKQVGRKLFDPTQSITVQDFEVWPGFATGVVFNSGHALLNVDMASKLVTNVNVLNVLGQLKQRGGHNFEALLSQEMVGKSVMTTYNRRFYRIDRIALDKTVNNKFSRGDGTEVTFLQYYQERYKKSIQVQGQPLLVSIDQKTKRESYLVPELCVMTGLNDEQRANRGLMGELDKHVKPDAGTRLSKCRGLLDKLQQNEQTRDFSGDWKLELRQEPLKVEGQRIEAGCLLFGEGKRVDIEQSQNLDRETQQKFFIGKAFNQLVVFYQRTMKQDFECFME